MFPYILMAPLVLSGGFLADWMRKKIHTTIVRKILTLVRKFSSFTHVWYPSRYLVHAKL